MWREKVIKEIKEIKEFKEIKERPSLISLNSFLFIYFQLRAVRRLPGYPHRAMHESWFECHAP